MHEMNIHRREGCVGSLTSTRDKTNSQYISEVQTYLTSWFCGVELGLKPTSNTDNILIFKNIKF